MISEKIPGRPICGLLSLALPIGVWLVEYCFVFIAAPAVVEKLNEPLHPVFFYLNVLLLFLPIAGITAGIAGLVRQERAKYLSVCGLCLSIVVLLGVFG